LTISIVTKFRLDHTIILPTLSIFGWHSRLLSYFKGRLDVGFRFHIPDTVTGWAALDLQYLHCLICIFFLFSLNITQRCRKFGIIPRHLNKFKEKFYYTT